MQIQITPVGLLTHAMYSSFDIREFVKPDDPEKTNIEDEYVRVSYRIKSSVSDMVKPRRILEIGTGAGYTAFSMLSPMPRSCYVGVDKDDSADGLFHYARTALPTFFPRADLRFIQADTQKDASAWLPALLQEGPFDLVFIDGDRSRLGVQNDLKLAYWAVRSGGFVLIEDYDHLPAVRYAVLDFLFTTAMPHIYCCTWRGDMLINVYKK